MQKGNKSAPLAPLKVDILSGLESVNAAILGSADTEQMLESVLDEILTIFNCERAWLVAPLLPEDEHFQIHTERTHPEFPGAGVTKERLPLDKATWGVFRLALESAVPVAFDLQGNHTEEFRASWEALEHFQIKSQLTIGIHPRSGGTWLLGIHHCRFPADYSEAERLFRAIAQRIGDGITTLHAENQLEQSERRFTTLVQTAPEAVLILDCDQGKYIDVNEKAELLYGRTREELLGGMDPVDLSPEFQPSGIPSTEAAAGLIAQTIAGSFPVFEWDNLHSSGRIVPCLTTLACLPHPTRTLVRGSVTDITDRKLAEEKQRELESHLVQSQKMEAIGNLTGGIAHDFNNLLTIILGHLDLLELEPSDEEHVLENVSHIRVASDRARSLTHRLLAFARRQPLRPQALHTGRLLQGMEDLLRRSLGETISVELVLRSDLWLCMADEAQLENSILNLAINARDAMPNGGNLTIEAGNASLDSEYADSHPEVEPGQYAVIAVTDNGSGMSTEVLNQALTPFFTTKETGKGTGLGLSMVYGFIKQSGGHFKISSEVDVGTTLKIYLPRSTANVAEDSLHSNSVTANQGKGQLILVVEDEESVLALTKSLLQHLGYQTLEASNGKEALRLIEQHPDIELLLTDIVLGNGMNGDEVAKRALMHRADLRVLYMSGYTANAIFDDGAPDSHVTLLQKPFSKQGLALHVQKVLTR